MMAQVTCTSCIYYRLIDNVHRCAAPGIVQDPVTGEPIPQPAALLRSAVGRCGPEGLKWVAAATNDPAIAQAPLSTAGYEVPPTVRERSIVPPA
jgi:hypothetical protein